MATLGEKIKYFRKRKGISQFDLETLTKLSPGSLSRIESGDVNPTKETLNILMQNLNLNTKEKLFLFGDFSEPLNKEDFYRIQTKIYTLFPPNELSYICDERFRIWDLSEIFKMVLNIDDKKVEKLRGHNILEFMFDKTLGISEYFDSEKFDELAKFQIARFKKELPYWEIDDYLNNLIKKLMQYDKFEIFWKDNLNDINLYSQYSKSVQFNFKGFKIKLNYSREHLEEYPRLQIVSYAIPRILKHVIKTYYGYFR